MQPIKRLTQIQTYKPSGILVTVNALPVIAFPATSIIEKQGVKQFYFWHKNKSILAKQNEAGWFARY